MCYLAMLLSLGLFGDRFSCSFSLKRWCLTEHEFIVICECDVYTLLFCIYQPFIVSLLTSSTGTYICLLTFVHLLM